ncbi:hypothetical protein MNV49_005379 [Pseudohyphozyma bogoriensis]|nr:hypothetical protein MNV49_005379 [Pseudohyphozyma bogoriensis]
MADHDENPVGTSPYAGKAVSDNTLELAGDGGTHRLDPLSAAVTNLGEHGNLFPQETANRNLSASGAGAGSGRGLGTNHIVQRQLKNPVANGFPPNSTSNHVSSGPSRALGEKEGEGGAAIRNEKVNGGHETGVIGATGPGDTHNGQGGHTKATVGDKLVGTVDVLVGKLTKNEAKVQEGELKKSGGASVV